jgi:hypothetical protein
MIRRNRNDENKQILTTDEREGAELIILSVFSLKLKLL